MTRTIHAPKGTELTCKNWLIEAAYRMIQNNLDRGRRVRSGQFDRLRRPRKSGAELGKLRRDFEKFEKSRTKTKRCWFNRENRSAIFK